MALTVEQQAIRSKGIGASEIGILFGLDKYRSELDLWLEKTGKLPATNGEPTPWQARGYRFERVVAEIYAEGHPTWDVRASERGTVVHPEHPLVIATPDFTVRTQQEFGVLAMHLLQVKTRRPSRDTLREFGPEGTDQLPMMVLAQTQWEMLALCVDRDDVAVLLGMDDYREYVVHADRELQQAMLDRAMTWWQRHVVEGQEPDIAGPSADAWLATKFRQTTDLVIDAAPEIEQILVQLASTRRTIAELEELQARYQHLIKTAIGESRGVQSAAGHRALWSTTKDSERVDWEACATEYRNMLALCAPPSMRESVKEVMPKYTKNKPGHRRFTFTSPSDE